MSQFALPELDAMQKIAIIVADLSPAERRRVGAWLVEYAAQEDAPQAAPASAEAPVAQQPAEPQAATAEPAEQPAEAEAAVTPESVAEPEAATPSTFAELYAAVAPRKGAQKAAVAGYWLETYQGQQSWKASEVNKLLKSIDVKVSSMSIVLTNAVKAANPLVVELARLGDGERSRKTFCLSEQGLAYVEGQIG